MTSVLITGAEGFVGSHLARHLLTQPELKLFGIVRDRDVALAAYRDGQVRFIPERRGDDTRVRVTFEEKARK